MPRVARATLALTALFVVPLCTAEEPQDRDTLRQRILERFDKNKDGRLDAAEREAAQQARAAFPSQQKKKGAPRDRERLLREFDKNNNGRLDPHELAALRKQLGGANKKGRDGNGRKGQSPQRRPGGDRPNPQFIQQLKRRFDANNNGRLDPPEIAKIRETYPQFGRRGRPGQPDQAKKKKGAGNRNKGGAQKNRGDANPARSAQILQRFDANKNGRLDPDELARIRQFRERAGGARGRGFRGQQAAPPRKNRVDQTALLEKFDTNKNGVLDGEERRKALAAIENK